MELFQLFGKIVIDNEKANKEIDQTTGKAEKSQGSVSKSFKKIGTGAINASKKLAGVGVAIGGAAVGLAEGSREYRTEMGKLEAGFTSSGHSAKTATKTYRSLYAVLGEEDTSVEAANHLAKLCNNEEDLNKWTDICTGVFATFGDSLPIEGLTEAANETAKVGQVTGPLADALNWAGVSEDEFNEKLAKCSTEQERQALITTTLNSLYSDAAQKYKTINKDVMDANLAQAKFTDAMAKLGAIVEPVLTKVKTAIAAVVNVIAGMPAPLQKIIAIIGAVIVVGAPLLAVFGAVANGIGSLISGIGKLGKAMKGVSAVFNLLKGALSLIAAHPVIAVIVAIVGAFIYLWNHCEGFREFWLNLWENIKTIAGTVWNALKDFFIAIWDGIKQAFETIFGGIANFFSAIWEGIKLVAETVWNGISTFLSMVWEGIKLVAETIFNGIVAFFSTIWDGIKVVAEFVWNGISLFLSTIWEGIKVVAETVFNGVAAFFSVIWDGIKTVAETVWNGISTFLSTIWNAIRTAAETVWNAISSFFGTVWNTIKNVITTVVDAISSFLSAAWNAIKNVISTVLDGIKTVVTTVWNAIKSTITTAVNGIKSVITTVWNAIKSFVNTVLNGIKSVITSAWNAIKSAVTTAVNAIKSVVTSVWNAIKSAVTTAMNSIKSVVTKAWNAIKSAVSAALNGIKGVVSSVWNGVKSIITGVLNTVKNAVSSAWNGLKSITSSAFNGIKSVATSVWNGIKAAITKPIEKARDTIKNIVEAIKGFFKNFNISLPHIKLPHFSISPRGWQLGDLLKGSIPSLGIEWYAKGGILTRPTIFGMNPVTGSAMVGGEAGDEAVAPIDTLMDYVRTAVKDENAGQAALLKSILTVLQAILKKDTSVQIDGNELIRIINKRLGAVY